MLGRTCYVAQPHARIWYGIRVGPGQSWVTSDDRVQFGLCGALAIPAAPGRWVELGLRKEAQEDPNDGVLLGK